MMQVVYSAFTPPEKRKRGNMENGSNNEISLRLSAHLQVCQKYREEIKHIQQYLPNWQPVFYDYEEG